MPKRIFIIAGEASGDVYGASLIEALQKIAPDVEIAGLGGDRMAATGMRFLYNLVREFSVMGLIPVILGIPKVMRFLEIILDDFHTHRPDLVVLIDYPGFNLYLATFTKRRKIPTVYYVTPQIWAWAPWRLKKIKRLIAKMLVIFPFEVPFYTKANIPVEYVGHPLLDRLARFQKSPRFMDDYHLAGPKMLALLPGSRSSQIKRNFSIMLWLASHMCQKADISSVCVAIASDKYLGLIQELMAQARQQYPLPAITWILGDTYNTIVHSRLCLVTSGTATLETAMLGTPLVILYQISQLQKWLVEVSSFLKCDFFGLPNIVSGKQIVPEFLVTNQTPGHLIPKILDLWDDTATRKKCLEDLIQMRQALHEPGASQKAAQAIWQMLVD